MKQLAPNWIVLVCLYPSIMLFGSLTGSLGGYNKSNGNGHNDIDDLPSEPSDKFWLIRSNSWFNQLFAYNGNTVFLGLFLIIVSLQVYFSREDARLSLPIEIRTISRIKQFQTKHYLRIAKEYICKLILKYFFLYLEFLFIDHLFVLTGGYCTNGSGTRDAMICRSGNGEWVGGFDISGHFCFLVTLSLIIWLELFKLEEFIRSRDLKSNVTNEVIFMVFFIVSILILWIVMLCVTSLYYHTFVEKLLGCIMGYICPIVMYRVLPRNTIFTRYIYK
ncbi:hypothetical protein TBLA_0A03110 [Henningerozyma blattae CBS 6284]|uniref:Uncharacterized protein n=1 Tax=Henningerozyma blattae (strain ATCC 34711 / CBS 6284 / DSM 70876 / NBRC 10599 / NRRL Y-10934 / UCD 77-7) TaxID=1071380 RepID=I2GVF9_HENB6|nr:hypothetical protein TBLA_0A03110 [Tetrapisispora blattae CBS 6284]CCH58111.1 hypothetical protein TBLA_0A03110 [Tetrapisispora blattae CBS 6284]